ncbi:hypothetical protein ACFLT7_03980 [candidate division KSB1 bacterium]
MRKLILFTFSLLVFVSPVHANVLKIAMGHPLSYDYSESSFWDSGDTRYISVDKYHEVQYKGTDIWLQYIFWDAFQLNFNYLVNGGRDYWTLATGLHLGEGGGIFGSLGLGISHTMDLREGHNVSDDDGPWTGFALPMNFGYNLQIHKKVGIFVMFEWQMFLFSNWNRTSLLGGLAIGS